MFHGTSANIYGLLIDPKKTFDSFLFKSDNLSTKKKVWQSQWAHVYSPSQTYTISCGPLWRLSHDSTRRPRLTKPFRDAGNAWWRWYRSVLGHCWRFSKEADATPMVNNTINTNLTSSFLIIREYLRRLSEPNVSNEVRDNASVILIGSTAGKYGEAGHVDYACSKSGKLTLSMSMFT